MSPKQPHQFIDGGSVYWRKSGSKYSHSAIHFESIDYMSPSAYGESLAHNAIWDKDS